MMTRKIETVVDDDIDPKEFIFALAQAGHLRVGWPLEDQIRAALEELGFIQVRVNRERLHAVFLVRANIGPGLVCASAPQARVLLHKAARKVGRRIVRNVLYPEVRRTSVRAALLFEGVTGEAAPGSNQRH